MQHHHIASSNHCSSCGGPVDGFICPGCGETSAKHDPDHWRKCPNGEKMKLKCLSCNKAETICNC